MENNYFKNDELARQVWEDKYQLNDETLNDFFERNSKEFSRLDNFNNFDSLNNQQYEELSEYGKLRSAFYKK